MPIGTVRFFNTTKGTGFIDPEKGGEPIPVFFANIESDGARLLAQGDRVQYELGVHKGKPTAVAVRRETPRYTGTADFEFDLGYGFIKQDLGGSNLFFHHSDLLASGGKVATIEDDERVEYEIVDGRDGKKKAARVLQLDPRPPLQKFADLGDFDRQLTDLGNKAQKESWEYRDAPSTRPPDTIQLPALHVRPDPGGGREDRRGNRRQRQTGRLLEHWVGLADSRRDLRVSRRGTAAKNRRSTRRDSVAAGLAATGIRPEE